MQQACARNGDSGPGCKDWPATGASTQGSASSKQPHGEELPVEVEVIQA